MEKSAKKRPSVGQGEEEVWKHSKPKPNEKEVEEFFALIRRIRSTAKLLGQENGRSLSVRWDDVVVVPFHTSVPEEKGVPGKREGSGTSSRDGSPALSKEEEEEKRDFVEENGLTVWLDLNVEAPADGENLL